MPVIPSAANASKKLRFLAIEEDRRRTIEALQNGSKTALADARFKYMQDVLGAIQGLGLPILRGWKLPEIKDPHFVDTYKTFAGEVGLAVTRYRFEVTPDTENSVGLSAEAKSEIHNYITRIKEFVAHSTTISREKKDMLLKRLLAFEREVDLERTGFAALGALMVVASDTLGQTAKNLEPIRRWVIPIVRLFAAAHGQAQITFEGQNLLANPTPVSQRAPSGARSRQRRST